MVIVKDKDCSRVPRVLVIGPGRAVRGGITAVLLAYEKSDIWAKYHCEWLETYVDGTTTDKLLVMVKAYISAPKLVYRSDILHIHTAGSTSLYRKIPIMLLGKLFRKKMIIHIHAANVEASFRGWLCSRISRLALSSADKVVSLSANWATIIRDIAVNADIVVIPNPCHCKDNQHHKTESKKPVILYAGKLEQRKGFLDLIRAMPTIIAAVPHAHLIMAGHGELAYGISLSQELGVADNVEFPGWVSGKEKEAVFDRAMVFCLPSYDEGVPMAMLEAMGQGLPVVVTPVGGIPNIITNRENGVLVASGDSNGIAQAIIEIMRNRVFSTRLSNAAIETVKSSFDLDIVCEHVAQLYDEVMK